MDTIDSPTKGEKVHEGKTKVVFAVKDRDDLVILGNKNDITKHDDATQTREFQGKAEYATTTTCNVFELLVAAGIPCAYRSQLSATEILVQRCRMIPLEVIIRRYAVGSALSRFPHLKTKEGTPPHRFHRLKFELFLKTTDGMVASVNGTTDSVRPITDGSGRVVNDPLIADYSGSVWRLQHPKVPEWESCSDAVIDALWPSDAILPEGVTVEKIEEITRKTFLVLEGAWAQSGCRLIDFKIEFGINASGELVVADVIDADSWRLRTHDWRELSKELFRQNVDLETVADKYALVANVSKRFALPQQAIVSWRGSPNDDLPQYLEIPGVTMKDIVRSGHKSSEGCLNVLEEVLAEFPDGGVILAMVGMSNGLGPMLAARTVWPVIAVPMTVAHRHHDIWSSLEVPSEVPLVTVLSPKNAVLAALNILAQKNPAAYMYRQYAIEELDIQS